MTESLNSLQEPAEDLQRALATIDMFLAAGSGRSSQALEALMLKLKNLRIRMDGSTNHARAHVHIDYGHQRHLARVM